MCRLPPTLAVKCQVLIKAVLKDPPDGVKTSSLKYLPNIIAVLLVLPISQSPHPQFLGRHPQIPKIDELDLGRPNCLAINGRPETVLKARNASLVTTLRLVSLSKY